MKTTRYLAVARATSGPKSSSTSERARSIPAVTPAEVMTLPSLTKIDSRSTMIFGKFAASSGTHRQWVAARCPSRIPVAASGKAPAHTEAMRRDDRERRAMPEMSSGSDTAARQSLGPGTIMVSIGPVTSSRAASTARRVPEVVRTSFDPGETVIHL
jgi:hypothetical protein